MTGLTSKLGNVTKLLNPWAAAIAGSIAAITKLNSLVQDRIDAGMPTANAREKATATLAGQLSSTAVLNPQVVVDKLELLSENGVASLDDLVKAYSKLVPVMRGNVNAALDWTARMADVQAATGLSAEQLTTAINQIKTTGNIEEEVAKKIPFWKELSEAMNMSIDDVKKLVQAHKVGSEDMLEALKNATEMYAGTAAALSATTEGSKASMEAAKGRAYSPYAEGRNNVLRAYYQERQAYYDNMASDETMRENNEILGEIHGQLEVLIKEIGDWLEEVGNGIMKQLGKLYERATGKNIKAEATTRENKTRTDNLERIMNRVERVGHEGSSEETRSLIKEMRDELKRLNDKKVSLNQEALGIQGRLVNEVNYPALLKLFEGAHSFFGADPMSADKAALYNYRFLTHGWLQEDGTLADKLSKTKDQPMLPIAPMTGPALLNDAIKRATGLDIAAGLNLKKNTDGMVAELDAISETLKGSDEVMVRYLDCLTMLEQLAVEQERVEKQRLEEAKQKSLVESSENIRTHEVMEGKDQKAISDLYGAASPEELIKQYEGIRDKALKSIVLTEEEVDKYKELEKPYKLLIKLRDEEAAAMKKQAEAEAEKKKKEEEAAKKALEEYNARAKHEHDDYIAKYDFKEGDRAVEHLRKMMEDMQELGMDSSSQASYIQKELIDMIQKASNGAIQKTQETISAGGIRSLKDFNYESVNYNEKQLQQVDAIKQSVASMDEFMGALVQKLPSPTMAQ